jgi:hypothetical protein
MLDIVFILHIFQQDLLVLGTKDSLVCGMNIHLLVPLHEGSQYPESVNKIYRNERQTGGWSNFIPVFRKHLSQKLHGNVSVSLPLSFLLSYRLHNAIRLIEHVIVHSDNIKQSSFTLF